MSSRTKSRIDRCCSRRSSRFLRRSRGRAGTEEPLEHQPRIGLGRHRDRGVAPRQVELVGTGIAGIAVARLAHAVAGELQRGKPRQVADALGRHLVDRDARVDVGAGRLLDPDARQERSARPGMVARPVQAAVGVDVVESAQDLDLLLDLFQRLQRPGELEIFALALGPPVTLIHAVGNVDIGHPQRGTRGRGRQRGGCPPAGAAAWLSRDE